MTTTSSSTTSTSRRHSAVLLTATAAVAAAVLLLLPSVTLAFLPPSLAGPLAVDSRRRVSAPPAWAAAAAALAPAPSPVVPLAAAATAAAAASNDDDEVEDEEEDEEEEDRGPRPPRPSTPPPIPISYESALLPSRAIDGAWNAQRKPLLRLGSKGVQRSHRNSLKELLAFHRVVRVKVNGPPSQSVKAIADALAAADPGETDALALVLRVKGKEFLLATPAEVEAIKKGKAPGGEAE